MFRPKLEILPAAQRRLWQELGPTPRSFVLYGGTALALRLGHRQSADFDFFSSTPFRPQTLLESMPYLQNAKILQSAENTLTCAVERQGRVQVSYFGGLDLRRVSDPDTAPGNGIYVASLLDIAGCKAGVIQQRAERRDYVDLAAILKSGLDMPTILAAGAAIYGRKFDSGIALRALASLEDGDLKELDTAVREELAAAMAVVKLQQLPVIQGFQGLCGEKGQV